MGKRGKNDRKSVDVSLKFFSHRHALSEEKVNQVSREENIERKSGNFHQKIPQTPICGSMLCDST